jgi:type I restriction enzyme S subunit
MVRHKSNIISAMQLTSFIQPPPKTEQDIIVKWLDSTLAGVQETLTAIVSQIDRLQEYRQALITAAVTGQLDIGAAA